jgi:hypothetical protein
MCCCSVLGNCIFVHPSVVTLSGQSILLGPSPFGSWHICVNEATPITTMLSSSKAVLLCTVNCMVDSIMIVNSNQTPGWQVLSTVQPKRVRYSGVWPVIYLRTSAWARSCRLVAYLPLFVDVNNLGSFRRRAALGKHFMLF